MSKQKFSFHDPKKIYINHNLDPEMQLEIIRLPRPYDYHGGDVYIEDIFDEMFIKGWHHIFKCVWIDREEKEIEDFSYIRSIIQRAAKWYAAKVISGEIELEHYQEPDAVFETERFKIQESSKPGWWIATHKEAGLCIEFRNRKFNETQRIVPLEDQDPDDFMNIAKNMRELTDWLSINHRDKV